MSEENEKIYLTAKNNDQTFYVNIGTGRMPVWRRIMKKKKLYSIPVVEVYQLSLDGGMLRSSVDTFESVNSKVSISKQEGFDNVHGGEFEILSWDD